MQEIPQVEAVKEDMDGAARQDDASAGGDRIAALEDRVAELSSALMHREKQIQAMHLVSEALFAHATVDAMVRETLHVAIEVLCADAGSLMTYEPKTDSLVFRYALGPSSESLIGYVMPASQGIAGRVFKTGVPDLAHDISSRQDHNPEVDQKTGFQTKTMMTVPVKRPTGEPIGVMQVLNSQKTFDHRDLEMLQVLSAQAAWAIENARLAQQARKAEIINVIGDISHDIKNMLTPIQTGVWTLEVLLNDLFKGLEEVCAKCPEAEPWGAEVARVAAEVRTDYGWILSNALDAAEKVQTRTKEIADAIKGELAPPRFEVGDLNETVQAVTRSLRLVALDAQVHLNLDLDPNLPAAEFDRKQMYNALYNLVNNAIPETPEDGTITVRTRGPQEGEDTLLLQVEDTGHGIPEHVRATLFTDEAISTKPGGTGLGTRIVAGVVRRHNATISVASEEGKGSTFTIRMPLRHDKNRTPSSLDQPLI